MLRASAPDAACAASATAFADLLREEQSALAAFTALLQTEQEALVQGDADRVGALAGEKASQLENLTRLGALRQRHLAAQNLEASAAGVQDWIERNAAIAPAVRAAWRHLLAQAQMAQQLNQGNGLLIAGRLQQNRIKLSALQNAAAADGVYRADGQLRPLRGARSIGQI